MLKRFLKFFKGDEQAEMPPFEGSYLDFVLEQIRPGVQDELEVCEEHDPLLLVIAEVLRVSMRGVWSTTLARPLVDQHSPGAAAAPPPPPASTSAPPPPAPPAAAEDEVVDDVEEVLDEIRDDAQTAEFVASETLPGDEADEEEVEVLDEDSELIEDVSEVEEVAAEDEGEDEADEEEIEVLDEDSELIEDVSEVVDEAEEFEIEQVIEDTGEDSEVGDDGLPRVDRKEVLQAGRVFLGMLIENDRLPAELQLGLEETMLARDLLVGYFVGNQDFEDRAQQLLRIVERKFSEGQFSQARILLQLFQTDRQTRIRNDRNIFYEDMIQRLGIRRRHPVASDAARAFAAIDVEADGGVVNMCRWLDENLFVKLHLFTREPTQVDTWSEIGEMSSRVGALDNLLKYLPPRRWRTSHGEGATDATVREHVRRHVNSDALAAYVINQMRTCYFVLRAVGDTGLEGYLDTFFDWVSESFDFNGTRLLPELYRRSMGDSHTMKIVFDDLYHRFLRQAAEAWLDELDDAAIDAALARAISTIHAVNLDEVPPGNYDLGGFVFDALFGITYPTPEFAFKLHRLT